MEFPKKTIDSVSVTWATDQAKSIIESTMRRAVNVANDPKKTERIAKRECLACFYLAGRVAGQAFTNQPCGICDKLMTFSSTCTDVICKECSDAHFLCIHCGADIKLRPRRIFKP